MNERCEICGEPVSEDQRAEMFDPRDESSLSVFCHVDCGLAHQYEVA